MAEMVKDWICGIVAVAVSPATKLKGATDVAVKPRQGHPAVFVGGRTEHSKHTVRFHVDRKEGEGYCFMCTRAHALLSAYPVLCWEETRDKDHGENWLIHSQVNHL